MSGETSAKIRLVRCPKCRLVLPETFDVPVYQCGGCGTYLQRSRGMKSTTESGLNLPDAVAESTEFPKKAFFLGEKSSNYRKRKPTLQRAELKITLTRERLAQIVEGVAWIKEQRHSTTAGKTTVVPFEVSLDILRRRIGAKTDISLNKVMEDIRNSEAGRIGIYGRARIGKTTFVKALKDRLALTDIFQCILWVSRVWSLKILEWQISRQLQSYEIDDKGTIYTMLKSIKFLLILDDVHQYINLQEIGIPEPTPENGSKIVLTSRSEKVCNIMKVDLKIRLEDFFSWELFYKNVGQVVDSPFIQPLARLVVSFCCYHSDAIIAMARALRDVSDADIWKKAIETLMRPPESDQDTLENLMVNVLKFSYEHLRDDKTRECLRNCILHGEERCFQKELIKRWILDGLVDAQDEGNINFESLMSSVLSKSVAMGRLVGMWKKSPNHIVSLEESRLFLVQGSMGLKKPPKVEEWERLKGIYLMDNALSELPKDPHCLELHSLFLERNCKLRMIPPPFFDYMPKLQVLNLSRTSIKSLPDSLFRLVNLRRLFLNHCGLITSLSPKVGELKQLEILDLEQTEIKYLPVEVGELKKLKCLEVSFFEPSSKRSSEQESSIIPCGVISALSNLEELNFDVSFDDKRWNASAEDVVSEVCKLQSLSTLKFYFPKVELLSYFKWDDGTIIEFPSPFPIESEDLIKSPFSCFRLTVGHIVERVISRLPRDIEFELERYGRYLKYVNGEEVPEDIKKVLKCATAFFVDRHSTLRAFSEFDDMNTVFLKCCVAGECNELQAIVDTDRIQMDSSSEREFFLFYSLENLYIYYMKNLRNIWKGPMISKWCFSSLESLTLRTCPELTSIFTPALLSNFVKLKELTIDDCPKITSLISSDGSEFKISCIVPALKRMSLHFLPKLASISNGLPISPRLEVMSFRYCQNLKSLPINRDFNVELRKIKGELSWWQELKWEGTQQDSWDDFFQAVDKLR